MIDFIEVYESLDSVRFNMPPLQFVQPSICVDKENVIARADIVFSCIRKDGNIAQQVASVFSSKEAELLKEAEVSELRKLREEKSELYRTIDELTHNLKTAKAENSELQDLVGRYKERLRELHLITNPLRQEGGL